MKLISSERLGASGLQVPGNSLVKLFLFNYLKVNRINKLFTHQLHPHKDIEFIEALLNQLNIHFEIPEGELNHIPKSGPYLVMANHPFGFLDGLLMINIFGRQNPDFKVLANFFLKEFEPIKNYFIDLNPFESNTAMNFKGLKAAFGALRNNQPIGVFPAGEVATMQKGFGKIEDKAWDPGIIKFMINTNVPIIPLYFYGANSLKFHLLGKIHPYLRTLSIPSEFFKKENETIQLRIGKPIMPAELKEFDNYARAGRYLRTCLYALGSKVEVKNFFRVNLHVSKRIEPIIEPVSTDEIETELAHLRENEGLLFTKSEFEIFLAKTEQIPNTLKELGRLREVTFRQVGEGTNRKLDIDEYDIYYHHLFVWSKNTKRIAGAYRIGIGHQILQQFSKKGFYITSLFNLDDEMIPVLKHTLELGRSFVVKEYQQKPLPLFLLWQGILHFLVKHPEYQYIMGPVSISNDFTRFSKDLLIAFIKKYYFDTEMAKLVHPQKEFVVKTNPEDIEVILERNKNDLQKLDKFIAGIEPGYLKIPVLLKQYIKQNARIIGFNVDPNFNNCLDGLMIMNLKDMPEDTLKFLNNR